MLGYLTDIERTMAAVNELRQRRGRLFFDVDARVRTDAGWPRTSAYDTPDAMILVAEVPGLTEKDLDITVKEDVLTISAERKELGPEGVGLHRPAFSRSFALPERMATDGLTAELKDGILTVRLPKAPEAQPRKIQVKAA
jgi:HSP20 family protein